MGAFYVNYTVKGADQQSVVRALSGRKAFVTPEWNGFTVVFDEESDKQDQVTIAILAVQLSTELRSTVLALLIHDSDILWFQLYEGGKLTDQYNSGRVIFLRKLKFYRRKVAMQSDLAQSSSAKTMLKSSEYYERPTKSAHSLGIGTRISFRCSTCPLLPLDTGFVRLPWAISQRDCRQRTWQLPTDENRCSGRVTAYVTVSLADDMSGGRS
jgi:hypothetical protein